MKSFRLMFAVAALSVLAISFARAGDEAKPAEQPKDKPACTCCCCKAKAEGQTCAEHKDGCCCQKQKACDQAAKPEQAKPAEAAKP